MAQQYSYVGVGIRRGDPIDSSAAVCLRIRNDTCPNRYYVVGPSG